MEQSTGGEDDEWELKPRRHHFLRSLFCCSFSLFIFFIGSTIKRFGLDHDSAASSLLTRILAILAILAHSSLQVTVLRGGEQRAEFAWLPLKASALGLGVVKLQI